jgi:2-polyprenyl-3-methyl-5-hydroxy-6-metoxy-1,4-benzoquinol methylase
MLSGKKLVAEVGCGDGFFSRVVQKEVGELHLYDFDASFINDANARGMVNLHWQNILDGELGRKFDAIYSLDVMEHIEYASQGVYLKNIKDSLSIGGVFIVGMPSLESQPYASEQSKIGHIGCLSYDEMKDTLQDNFSNVFMFGMNDESLHTGFGGMCHYLMAVCV